MNLTEKVNCGKLKLGVFNRKPSQYGVKPFMGLATGKPAPSSRKDSTLSSKVNWGKSRQSISSSGVPSEASINNEDSNVVLALSEGRGQARCEVGIAVINVSQPHLILCQISDTQSYDNTLRKINIFNPSQILVPMTFVASANQSRLIEKVKEQFPQVTYTPVRRNTYNKTSGMEFVQEYCVSSLNSVLLVLQYRYYALTAASALFRFLQNSLNIFYASGSIKIDYQESEGYALIDVSTADRLELVSSTKPLQASKYSTLFGVLNNCYTRIGERALRTILLQPPFVTSIILERQECVTALMRHPEKLQSIQVMLQKLGNVDQLLTLPTIVVDDSQTCSNRQLNYILYLNGLTDLIITLSDVISYFDQTLFKNISITLKNPDFISIRDMVRTLIHENAYAAKSHNGLLQRCFAIKPGINGLLDLVRKIYSERLDDMREYVKILGEKYNLPLTLGNNITKGYHIVFSLNKHQRITMKKSDIPKEFIQVSRLTNSFTMKTMELINFQTRIDDIIADILKISNVMIFKTLTSFKKYMSLFYRLCEDIATIDVVQSLAEISIRNNYVKPTFSDFTEVKESQHPMLDMLAHEKPVPNSISSCQYFNVHIITGPNGSGKSIYIRQLMLLQIMAQIGGYVPASSAIFRPADRMFARIYLEDNMECGASSFVLEMKEIIYILSHMTDFSLIIIDELARSTSLEEGAALAMAIYECFVNSSAFVYLTSHYTLVTKLGDMYLNVKNWFMDTESSGDTPKSLKLNFKHTIKPGVANLKRYGIFMVKNIWPADLMEDVYALLEHNIKTQKEIKTQQLSRESRLKYNLDADLQKLRVKGKLNPSKINELINHYQINMENINLNMGNVYEEKSDQENVSDFEDPVTDDVLSEAMDQVEYLLTSSQANSNNSSYKRLSYFIGENSENINLLNPEIKIYEPSINCEEEMCPVDYNLNQTSNQNIKILSNVVLKGKINYPCRNSQLEQLSNLRGYSQESYQNSQDLEEINEINRSLLTEMHLAKKNFREMDSKLLYEDPLLEIENVSKNLDFCMENKYDETQNTTVEKITSQGHSFQSCVEGDNQISDFCFLKPSEPPLKKRFNFKSQSLTNEKTENFDDTDQMTFSLALFQNRDKTSTPISSRNCFSLQEDRKINFTEFLDSKIDNTSNYSREHTFSQTNSQPWMCEPSTNKTENLINVRNQSRQRDYIDLIEDTISDEKKSDLQKNLISPITQEYNNKRNMAESSIKIQEVQSNSQEFKNCSIKHNMHIFPEINILEGPNNKTLSFGEEDKPCITLKKTKLNENIEDKNFAINKVKIDRNLEQFVIEETKMFLSHSADIFDGDVDQLEITIETNEHSKKSHEDLSENVISILKSDIIPLTGHKKWRDVDEEISIQDTQPEVKYKVDCNLTKKSIDSKIEKQNYPVRDITETFIKEEMVGLNDHLEANETPKNSNKCDSISNRSSDEENSIQTSKSPDNLIEKPNFDTYMNDDLTIIKVISNSEQLNNSVQQKLLSRANTCTNNELNQKSIIYNNISENKSGKNLLKTATSVNYESARDNSKYTVFTTLSDDIEKKNLDNSSSVKNRKNTVSTSLSEASRKRNLDNSSSVSTSSNNQDVFEVIKKKSKLHLSQLNIKSDLPGSFSKFSTSKMFISENNDSTSSSSRDKVTTSISDASRKRNLDNPTSISSDFEEVSIEVEKQRSNFPTFSKNHSREQLLVDSMLKSTSNQQESFDDKFEDREEGTVKKDSDSSCACYNLALETNIFSEKSNSNEIDSSQRKQCNKEEIDSKRFTSTSKCSTEIFVDAASMHTETADVSSFTNILEKTGDGNQETDNLNNSNFENSFTFSNEDSLNKNTAKSQLTKKKYLGYGRRPKKETKIISNTKKCEEYKMCKSLYKPVKLTKYQIQEEFNKQDQIILEGNLDVETYEKYLMQRMNRPSVKQIQNAEHIATFRKTENGTILLPNHKKKHKPRKTKDFQGNKLVDVSIFSDQNANKMSAFLASKERNYNQFKFVPNTQYVGFDEDSRGINFCSQFVQKSKRIEFNRSKSFGEFKFQRFSDIISYHNSSFRVKANIDYLQSQQSCSSSIFLPDGFLKDNKKDIDIICSKYLDDSQPRFYRAKTSPLS